MKAFLGVDTARQFFLWEEAVVKEINPKLDLIDIPDELWEEYWTAHTNYMIVQDKLKERYGK